MSLINRLKQGIRESRKTEEMQSAIEKQAATIDYMAIMADIELPEAEESEAMNNVE